MKKKSIVMLDIIIIILLVITTILKIEKNEARKISLKEEISNHYNKYVKTNKECNIYDKNENNVGIIGNNVEISLKENNINEDTKYFLVEDFDEEYYIKYQDVYKIEKLTKEDDRYKKYIVFNENIITTNDTSFYDINDNLIYKFNKSFSLPIIIKDENKYGVEFNNKLLYIYKDNVSSIEKNINTSKNNTKGVGVLNYHAFYDEENEEEKNSCTTEICHSKGQFKSHLDFIKEKNLLTIKMEELEMYIDGKIQLPPSILITIDDGGRTKLAVDMLTEYKMYATIFLITSWYDPSSYYKTEYIELHSHSDNMHNQGVCPTGQGGGIKCLPENEIQRDLKMSRNKLNNTKYFCFPFYEYNNYAIEMLKKAGFTMAFIGESNYSDNLVHVGADKFKLRRFVIVTYTTIDDLDRYFKKIY